MIITIIFVILLLIGLIGLVTLFINSIIWLIKYIRKIDNKLTLKRIKKNTFFLLIVIILGAGAVWFSQLMASTPAIKDESGKVIEGSIAELKEVSLNGRKEWISIRGNNKTKPILLFLAGGPGGSQMATVRHDLAELEKHFVVVNWDQAGSAKSYGSNQIKNITVEDYINDGIALTNYLCNTFNQEKIYLMGESWGSALGIFLADKAPELYHAFIGTGQMVAFLETEKIDYQLVLKMASDKGDSKTVEALKKNGEPPYFGSDVTWKSLTYLSYLNNYMTSNPAIHNGGYNTFRDLFSSEYGIFDKINYLRGMVDTFNAVYPKLYDIDLRTDYPNLDIPIYFFLGRHDLNAPTSLVEDYYSVLNAPKKEIVWFEHSGHSPWINESELFILETFRVTGVQ